MRLWESEPVKNFLKKFQKGVDKLGYCVIVIYEFPFY